MKRIISVATNKFQGFWFYDSFSPLLEREQYENSLLIPNSKGFCKSVYARKIWYYKGQQSLPFVFSTYHTNKWFFVVK